MKFGHKKEIIILSTLSFLTMLVIFNLGMFTGNAGKVVKSAIQESDMTTAEIIPSKITPGEHINIHLTPGSKCTDKKIEIYKEGAKHPSATFEIKEARTLGGYKLCRPLVKSYKSWATWKGKYYARIKDIGSGKYIKIYFRVE